LITSKPAGLIISDILSISAISTKIVLDQLYLLNFKKGGNAGRTQSASGPASFFGDALIHKNRFPTMAIWYWFTKSRVVWGKWHLRVFYNQPDSTARMR
jgi:hypothetical protein